MSKIGKRIARRLREEVGINLLGDDINYSCKRDQYTVYHNRVGGLDAITWYLHDGIGWAQAIQEDGTIETVFIGSDMPASRIATCPEWDVEIDQNHINILCGCYQGGCYSKERIKKDKRR